MFSHPQCNQLYRHICTILVCCDTMRLLNNRLYQVYIHPHLEKTIILHGVEELGTCNSPIRVRAIDLSSSYLAWKFQFWGPFLLKIVVHRTFHDEKKIHYSGNSIHMVKTKFSKRRNSRSECPNIVKFRCRLIILRSIFGKDLVESA
jgi:hypothetical protein